MSELEIKRNRLKAIKKLLFWGISLIPAFIVTQMDINLFGWGVKATNLFVWFLIIVAICAICEIFRRLLTKQSGLKLTQDGFYMWENFISWMEVHEIRKMTIGGDPSLLIDLKDPAASKKRLSKEARAEKRMKPKFYGKPIHVEINDLDIDFDALEAAFNSYFNRYS